MCNTLKIVWTLPNVTSSLYYFVHSHCWGSYLFSYGTTDPAFHMSQRPKHSQSFWLQAYNSMQSHIHKCINILHTDACLCCWCPTTPNSASKWCSWINWRTKSAASILASCCTGMFTISVCPSHTATIRAVTPFCNACQQCNSKLQKIWFSLAKHIEMYNTLKIVNILQNMTFSIYYFMHSHSWGS